MLRSLDGSVQEFQTEGRLPKELTGTNLTLVPNIAFQSASADMIDFNRGAFHLESDLDTIVFILQSASPTFDGYVNTTALDGPNDRYTFEFDFLLRYVRVVVVSDFAAKFTYTLIAKTQFRPPTFLDVTTTPAIHNPLFTHRLNNYYPEGDLFDAGVALHPNFKAAFYIRARITCVCQVNILHTGAGAVNTKVNFSLDWSNNVNYYNNWTNVTGNSISPYIRVPASVNDVELNDINMGWVEGALGVGLNEFHSEKFQLSEGHGLRMRFSSTDANRVYICYSLTVFWLLKNFFCFQILFVHFISKSWNAF